jgi:hypothetical protein
MKNIVLILVFSFAMYGVQAFAAVQSSETSSTRAKSSSRIRSSGPHSIKRLIPQFSLIVSNFAGDSSEGFNNKTGFGAGVTAEIGSSKMVVETGLLYKQSGAKAPFDYLQNGGGVATTDLHVDLAYLGIPLLGKYYFSGQQSDSLYLKGGLIPSLVVAKSISLEMNGQSFSESGFEMNGFDLAATIGLGGRFNVNPASDLLIEVSYARSFTQTGLVGAPDLFNSGVSVTAGLGIGL